MLKTEIRRSHNEIIAIIKHTVELGTGAKIQELELYGVKPEQEPGETGLRMSGFLRVRTRQGDIGEVELDHDQLLNWINAYLAKEGYHKFSQDHLFRGEPGFTTYEGGPKRYGNLVMTFWVDLHDPENNRDVL